MKQQFDKAQRELERLLGEATRKREEQGKELDRIRQEVLAKQTDNQQVAAKNGELAHEAERLSAYAQQLRENIQDMMGDYSH